MTTTGQLGTPQSRPSLIVLGSVLRNSLPSRVRATAATTSRTTATVTQTGRKTGTVSQ